MILLRSEAAIPGACLEMIGPLPARAVAGLMGVLIRTLRPVGSYPTREWPHDEHSERSYLLASER